MSADNFRVRRQTTHSWAARSRRVPRVARIHYKEAKQLFDRAIEAQAKTAGRNQVVDGPGDRTASKGRRVREGSQRRGDDPIVTEILDSQEEMCVKFTPMRQHFFQKRNCSTQNCQRT